MTKGVCRNGHDLTLPDSRTGAARACRICWNAYCALRRKKDNGKAQREYAERKAQGLVTSDG